MISARADIRPMLRVRLGRRLVEYAGLMTIGVAAPFYETAIRLSSKFPLTVSETLLTALVLQVGVPALLVLAFVAAGRRGRLLDAAIIAMVITVPTRIMASRWLTDLTPTLRIATALAFVMLALVLVIKRRALVAEWLHAIGVLSPLAVIWLLSASTPTGKLPVSPGAAAPPVVVLLFDELSLSSLLRDGRIDEERFPNFAKLSEESWWLRNATTNFTRTAYSVPSLLTGSLEAGRSGSLEATPKPNLMSLLDERIETMGLNSLWFKCPLRMEKCTEAPPGPPAGIRAPAVIFLSRLVPSALQWRFFPGIDMSPAWEQMRPASAYAARISRGGFYFLHSVATHHPAVLTPDGHVAPLSGPLPYTRDGEGRLVAASPLVRSRMIDQARYADRELGRIMDGMRRSGTWADATFVVIADHGSCWSGSCNRLFPSEMSEIEPSLLRVPFFIKSPTARAHIDDRAAQLVDLLPTLMALLDLPVAKSQRLDGVNLAAISAATPRKICIAEGFANCRFFPVPARIEAPIDVR